VLLTDSPFGNPVAPKVVGVFVAVIWYENAVPTVPLAAVALVIAGAPAAIVSVRVAWPVPLPLVALNVTVEVPAAVGVPEINPLVPFTDSPAGNPVAPKLVGVFVAVIWYESAVPTVPFAVVALVMLGVDDTVKFTPLLATPPTVTTTLPDVAPLGTDVAMLVALQVVTVAAVPLNLTVLVPCEDPKFVPVIVTGVPTDPDVVETPIMVGVPATLFSTKYSE
jgi:hypothetical protein